MKKILMALAALTVISPAFGQLGNAKQIWSRTIAPTAPSNLQCLVWVSARNRWEPGSCAAAGSGTVTSVGFTGGLVSVANPTTTPAFTVAGTSGGLVYFSSATTWASSGAMASGQFVLGGGAGAAPTTSFSVVTAAKGGTSFSSYTKGDTICPSASTTLTKLAVGTDGQVLTADAASTCGIKWSTGGGGGSGTVTTVGFTGGLISVANPTTTPALTVAGTSGGIVYFSSSSTWASSGVLGANLPLFGGGAGASPIAGTRSGNTTAVVTTTGTQTASDCVSIDANGNHVANGAACLSAAALAGVYVANAGSNTILAGTGNLLTSSATKSAAVLVPVANPSAPVAGSISVDLSGSYGWFSGTFWNYFTNTSSGNRTFTLPDASGTVALTTSNVATATALATARAIYGNNFDGTAALTQVVASTYGGTGNGFTKFSGPGTSEKTFTLPNASATLSYTVASGAKALATGAISSAACTSAQTDTATGTLTTDTVTASFNGDPTGVTGYVPLTAGMLTIIAYPTADTVNFKVCNNTTGSITPGAITLNWRVVR